MDTKTDREAEFKVFDQAEKYIWFAERHNNPRVSFMYFSDDSL